MVESAEPTSEPLPPGFFKNAIAEIRKHWVDPAARRQGIDPSKVHRAFVIGNTGVAEVRINDAVKAAVYVGEDRIVDLDQAAELLPRGASDENFKGLLPDVGPDDPYSFFDLQLRYLSFDYQPGRELARRHLARADQFWHAAGDLVARGAIDAACENMFAAAELATMALMEGTNGAVRGHSARSTWLEANGPTYGLTSEDSATLGKLLQARNVYRYGDSRSTITPVVLLELYMHVQNVLRAAQRAVDPSIS
ncbi:MAG TPA: HEPN domain-containing protein [Acidimicrobiales bacterium]|nr:HEPN domain-containing protein [Acidimicrobiales bacterium]